MYFLKIFGRLEYGPAMYRYILGLLFSTTTCSVMTFRQLTKDNIIKTKHMCNVL